MAGTRADPWIDLGMPVRLVLLADGKYALAVAGTSLSALSTKLDTLHADLVALGTKLDAIAANTAA